jgi:CRISPR/Cas system-associated exonuclease Cas4 (RecB family)
MKPMKPFDISRLEGNGEQPIDPPPDSSGDQVTGLDFPPADLAAKISPENFSEWYREREYESNIRDGKHYFNGPGKVKPATDHSPSSLIQCHRKIAYRQLNAPEEQADPLGIFWSGTLFEENLVQPYLEDIFTDPNTYVTNSIWVNFTLDHGNETLRVKGVTDPVIVDPDGGPRLVTEVKSKRSVEDLDEPNPHHNAQAHCYMYGLSEKYDRAITDAVILYGSRTSLEIKPFHVQFDAEFWEDEVVDWIQTHSRYRMFGILPPASPELGWECRYCSYKHRCGESDKLYNDIGPYGLLPKFADYPKVKVREYLESHPGAKLTPTLAYTYPDLTEEYETYDWECAGCGETVDWDQVEYDPNESNGPTCPACQSRSLRGPDPSDQQPIPRGADDG